MSDAVLSDTLLSTRQPTSLKALVQDFISMVLIVREGRQVTSLAAFEDSVERFFNEFERTARSAHYSADQVRDTQYAVCAFFDESVLRTEDSQLRQALELQTLQFRYFGVHLAGQGFFDKLETLRADVPANLEVLEVYHLCLALGFEGKFSLGQKDQLRYLANSLGQDIARYRKPSRTMTPDWALPEQVSQTLRHEVPMWMYLGLIALTCTGVYLLLDHLLDRDVAALSEQIRQLFGA